MKRVPSPRYMWIALYVGNDSGREKRITNGEAWATRAMAREWVRDEGRDYAHEYRIVRYALSRVTPRAKEKGQ